MDSFCRLCLQDDTSNSFSFFTTKIEELEWFYKTISNNHFKNSEEYITSKICLPCLTKVLDFKDFRNKVILNDSVGSVRLTRSHQVKREEINKPATTFNSTADSLKEKEEFYSEVVEIKMENLEDTTDNIYSDVEYDVYGEYMKQEVEGKEMTLSPTTSVKKVNTSIPIMPKKLKVKKFIYSDHGIVLKTNGKINKLTKVICNYCNSELSYSGFKHHYNVLHHQIVSYSCDQCDQSFARNFWLKQHKLLVHSMLDSFDFPCKLCDKSFPIKTLLTSHVYKKHTKLKVSAKKEKKFACEFPGCPKGFNILSYLNRHYKVEHLKIKENPCMFCDRAFLTKPDLREHITKEHGEFLPKNVASVSESIRKAKTKEIMKQKVLCTLCGKSFRRDVLSKHTKLVHLRMKDYECDICGKRYGLKFHIRDHMLRHMGIKTFACLKCDKGFTNPSDLRTHRNQTHKLTEIFSCTYPDCNKSFNMKQKVTKHIEFYHLRLRPYSCSMCDKRFFAKTQIAKHEAEHFDENNYVCIIPTCGKQYKSARKLAVHTKAQHTTPKFKCNFCDKSYHHPKQIREHENVHKNIREYSCSLCDKAYSTSSYLRMHVKDTHFNAKISCELCGSKLARRENYTMHVKSVHKDLEKNAMDTLLAKIKTIKADYDRMEYVYM